MNERRPMLPPVSLEPRLSYLAVRTYRTMHDELPMVEIKRRLSWVDFLAPLSEEQLDDLLLRAGFVRLEEGEELVVGPEEQAERMVLLVAGQLQVYMMSPSERELTLSVLASGSVVASTGLVPRWARELHIRALEASVVCRLEREDLEALVRTDPEVGLRLARMLATRVMLMEDRWADMAEKEVLARLAGLLYMLVQSEGVMSQEGPMIPTHYTHQQLGSMIGANRESVTRAFAELQEGRCVEQKNRRVYVRDYDTLLQKAAE
jgi:CRP/FNR family cyclic AMP-dependent transcriptional regulator